MAIGHIVGGALQGLGAGMAAKGQMDAEERRQFALERVRQQNAMEMANVGKENQKELIGVQTNANMDLDTHQAKNDDWRDARSTQRQMASTITVNNNQAQNQSKLQKEGFGQQLTLKSVDFANEKEMTRFRAGLDMQGVQQRAQIEQQMRSGEISDVKEGEDGTYYAIRRDGSVSSLGFRSVTQASPFGDRISSAGGTPPPAPAPAPARQPAAQPKAQQAQTQGKTYTKAEAAATAKNRGMTEEQVHRIMRENGYKLVGG
jgi:hypothetical protein